MQLQDAHRRLLIDGKLVEAGRTFPSLNPATGEVLGHAPDATVGDAEAAVAAARLAFDATAWATDVPHRIRCLEQLHQALADHQEELRDLTIADCGATRMSTYGAQLDEPIGIIRYYADLLLSYPINGGSYYAPDAPFGGYKQSGIGREMGVAGLEEFLERKTLATVVS